MKAPAASIPVELSTVQRWFQAVVTHPEGVAEGAASVAARSLINVAPGELETLITASSKLGAAERLAVYANAYYVRLIECLGDVFPLVRKVVGEEGFGDFAVEYLQSFPSKTYTLHTLGERFPEFLETVRPERETSGGPDWADFVIDLARFEWAIYEVFDGPGLEENPPALADALLEVPADRWSELRLRAAPCLRLLRARFPVNDFFTAARAAGSDEVPPAPSATESFVALSRKDYVVRRFALPQAQFEVLEKLVAGEALGMVLEKSLSGETAADPQTAVEQLRAWFSLWSREGFFTGFVLSSGFPAAEVTV